MTGFFIKSVFRTLLKAWLSLKTELRYRSEAHSKFASKVNSLPKYLWTKVNVVVTDQRTN